jgi:hypothetical protein
MAAAGAMLTAIFSHAESVGREMDDSVSLGGGLQCGFRTNRGRFWSIDFQQFSYFLS